MINFFWILALVDGLKWTTFYATSSQSTTTSEISLHFLFNGVTIFIHRPGGFLSATVFYIAITVEIRQRLIVSLTLVN